VAAQFLALTRVGEGFPEAIIEHNSWRGDDTLVLRKEWLLPVMKFLKQEPDLDYQILMDLTGVDYLPRQPRFELVYNLYSLSRKNRLRVKVRLAEETPEVESVVGLWPIANWLEREVWDMFGVRFRGHPDLKRILMYDGFAGHPLRKDYPVTKRQPLIGPKE
jgi:NADH-quinone oxidoreductase subunit C